MNLSWKSFRDLTDPETPGQTEPASAGFFKTKQRKIYHQEKKQWKWKTWTFQFGLFILEISGPLLLCEWTVIMTVFHVLPAVPRSVLHPVQSAVTKGPSGTKTWAHEIEWTNELWRSPRCLLLWFRWSGQTGPVLCLVDEVVSVLCKHVQPCLPKIILISVPIGPHVTLTLPQDFMALFPQLRAFASVLWRTVVLSKH